MAVKPIIFSGPMVRALLEGRKTQTRRVLKPQPIYLTGRGRRIYRDEDYRASWDEDEWADLGCAPGDLLWVREAWRTGAAFDETAPRDLPRSVHIAFEADCDRARLTGRLRPSIFMPRRYSRLTLEVTDVRVQRLQDISEEDAQAEGVRPAFSSPSLNIISAVPRYTWGFEELWDSINGEGAWERNDWVAAYSLYVHPLMNVDFMLNAGMLASEEGSAHASVSQ